MPLHFSDKQTHVLVSGATGFIGRHLVHALLADGHQVTVLSRHPERALQLFHRRVAAIASLTGFAPTPPVQVVVNLAGARILGPRWSDRRKTVLRESRTRLTNQLVQWMAAASHKPELLLSASAIGYYGIEPQGDDTPLTEDSPPQAIFMSQLCQEWENAAEGASALGVRVVRMRFGLVLGEQGALPMMMLPIRLGLGGPLGSGRQWLSWIHVDDLLRAIAHIWRRHARAESAAGEAGAYNFTAPQAVPQQQFSATAAELCHRPCILPTPAFAMRLLLGEQADLLLEGQRVTPQRLQAQGFAFVYPELRGALASLLQAGPRSAL
jgi:uncharacterized protein (TIGR01777 family)